MLIISHNTMRYRCLMLCSTLLSVRQSAYIGEYNGFMYASDTCEGFMCMYKDFMCIYVCEYMYVRVVDPPADGCGCGVQ